LWASRSSPHDRGSSRSDGDRGEVTEQQIPVLVIGDVSARRLGAAGSDRPSTVYIREHCQRLRATFSGAPTWSQW
jgi:hypothetical protein